MVAACASSVPSRTTGDQDRQADDEGHGRRESATAPARSSPPRSWNPPSTRSSANAWSKSSRCAGAPRGAHLLLQIRTRVLNDTLADDYRRWYPDFTHTPTGRTKPRSLPRFVPLSSPRPGRNRRATPRHPPVSSLLLAQDPLMAGIGLTLAAPNDGPAFSGLRSSVRHAGPGLADHVTDGHSNLAGGDLRPW